MTVAAPPTFSIADVRRWGFRAMRPSVVIDWLIDLHYVERVGEDEFVVTAEGVAASQAWRELAAELLEVE